MVEGMVDMRKRELRAKLLRARKMIPDVERVRTDDAVTRHLVGLPAFRDATVVLTYLSFGREVDTHALIERAWASGRVVALPRCVEGTRDMEWYRIESFDGLVRSPIGVSEPPRNPETRQSVGDSADELVVVPGLTFDPQGYRLGYGGGYYDTFLAGFHGVKVGLCRTSQMSNDLQAEGVVDGHDLPVDIVVTEDGAMEVTHA